MVIRNQQRTGFNDSCISGPRGNSDLKPRCDWQHALDVTATAAAASKTHPRKMVRLRPINHATEPTSSFGLLGCSFPLSLSMSQKNRSATRFRWRAMKPYAVQFFSENVLRQPLDDEDGEYTTDRIDVPFTTPEGAWI